MIPRPMNPTVSDTTAEATGRGRRDSKARRHWAAPARACRHPAGAHVRRVGERLPCDGRHDPASTPVTPSLRIVTLRGGGGDDLVGLGEVLVRRAVAVLRQRRALAGRTATRRRPALD